MRIPHRGAVTLCVAGAAVAAFVFPAAPLLQYDRAAVAAGGWWRLLTCHLTHWTFDHLLWDVATFVGLAVACERRGRRPLAATLLASAVAIPLAVYAWLPAMATYRGLSGLDSALFALLAVTLLREKPARRDWRWVALIGAFAGGFVVKTLIELGDETVFVSDSAAFVPVPLAHLVGAACGTAIGLYRSMGDSPMASRYSATGAARHQPSRERLWVRRLARGVGRRPGRSAIADSAEYRRRARVHAYMGRMPMPR